MNNRTYVIRIQYILKGGGASPDAHKYFRFLIFLLPCLDFQRHTNPCTQYCFISHYRIIVLAAVIAKYVILEIQQQCRQAPDTGDG